MARSFPFSLFFPHTVERLAFLTAFLEKHAPPHVVYNWYIRRWALRRTHQPTTCHVFLNIRWRTSSLLLALGGLECASALRGKKWRLWKISSGEDARSQQRFK